MRSVRRYLYHRSYILTHRPGDTSQEPEKPTTGLPAAAKDSGCVNRECRLYTLHILPGPLATQYKSHPSQTPQSSPWDTHCPVAPRPKYLSSENCESELQSTGGELRSPYYPDIYGSNVTCRWTLTPPPGHLLHILVARLRLDAGDTLQVSDGQKDLKVTGIPYNAGRLLELRPSPSATLFFSSDQQHNRGYFLLKYSSFREGSCDFQISPCGWLSSDPLQAWAFHGSQGRMAVAEESGLGMQHPRGYRASLTSPLITPGPPSTPLPTDGFPMCLRLDYLLDGPDAFLLTAAVTEEAELRGNGGSSTPFFPSARNLLFLYGPHGNESITTAVNFTVDGPFRVSIVYERGYGPHYTVGLTGVLVSEGHCGGDLDSLTATTCSFTKDFCGWRNTHTDHRNWLLTDHGVVAEVRSGTVSPKNRDKPDSKYVSVSTVQEQQWADLLSPPATTRNDLEGACLTLHYRILSENSELQVLLKPSPLVDEGGDGVGGGGGGAGIRRGERRGHGGSHQEKGPQEVLLWAQGRVRSPSVMEALINLDRQRLPERYQLILRAVGVGGGGASGGVEVQGLTLKPGSCSAGPSCNFDNGFCSWKVSYTGGTVWYINPDLGKDEEGSHAAVLAEGKTGDMTSLTSEVVSGEDPVSLTFRYRVVETSKCLSVGQQEVGGANDPPKGSPQPVIIWNQCRGKGHHWLHECISLPSLDKEYQVVLTAGTGEPTSEVWVDDVQVVRAICNVSVSQTAPATSLATPPQWRCEPDGSLCGMTQPPHGRRDWVYVHVPPAEIDSNHTTISLPLASTTHTPPVNDLHLDVPPTPAQRMCKDGTPLDATWVCDGIPDCADESDEEDCECEEEDLECAVTASSTLHLGAGVCAEGAFRCPSGRACSSGDCEEPLGPCLPRELVCNGEADCYGAEDEVACVGVARTNPEHETVGGSETMQCSGGLRIPAAWRCDGRKDCPLDGLDEVGCGYCGPDQFICPTSGVCVPSEQVCDGADSMPGCTDEQYCDSCPPAHLVCDVCVAT
ncbi:MAM and LDL-receptor class A domain-containing protein 2-like [Penaeus japonicus]|uniref:MAM and LDL-receptor class A domain-containing protein 2-like n=1 Tax=Penaeus japonicus TaxID=27405 RepID=UPI001C71111D|nr:MAM and LDL-receptor class A domain-containing protein 2-like [Penaeus japonicus]